MVVVVAASTYTWQPAHAHPFHHHHLHHHHHHHHHLRMSASPQSPPAAHSRPPPPPHPRLPQLCIRSASDFPETKNKDRELRKDVRLKRRFEARGGEGQPRDGTRGSGCQSWISSELSHCPPTIDTLAYTHTHTHTHTHTLQFSSPRSWIRLIFGYLKNVTMYITFFFPCAKYLRHCQPSFGTVLPLQCLSRLALHPYISIISLSCTSLARLWDGGEALTPGHLQHNHQRELPKLPVTLAHPGPVLFPLLPTHPSPPRSAKPKTSYKKKTVVCIV